MVVAPFASNPHRVSWSPLRRDLADSLFFCLLATVLRCALNSRSGGNSNKRGDVFRSDNHPVILAASAGLQLIAKQLAYHQDNETLLTVLASGYGAKLKHCGRGHHLNIASMSEQVDDLAVAVYCLAKDQFIKWADGSLTNL